MKGKGREKERKKVVMCPFCGYKWIARVEKPKECPLCKRYLISPSRKSKSNNKKRKRR